MQQHTKFWFFVHLALLVIVIVLDVALVGTEVVKWSCVFVA
jgi:hypothetical protein